MIIKKYQASTEKDAMLLVKEELGKDAIIMNIKHTKPKGIYRFLKKSVVEVTAAIDDTPKEPVVHQTSKNEMFKSDKNSPWTSEYNQALSRGDIILDHREVQNVNAEEANTAIEMKLDTLQTMIEEQITKREVKTIKKEESVFDLPCVKLIKEQLMENELSAENTQTILNEIEASISKDSSVDNVLANIYQKIVLKIGQPKTIHLEEGSTKFVFFIGPTGVGKTTTIAKIASSMKLRSNIKVTNLKIAASIPYVAVDMAGAVLSVPAIEFGKLGDKSLLIQSQFLEDEKEVNGYFILIPTEDSYNKILSSLGL